VFSDRVGRGAVADRAAIKAEIKQLVEDGIQLWRRELVATADPDERAAFLESLDDDERVELSKKPFFIREYQKWYSPALRLVEQLLPDRYSEFRDLYRNERRKTLSAETYGIADFIASIGPYGWNAAARTASGMSCFQQQLSILETAEPRLDSVLADLGRSLHSEILDDELGAARNLLDASHVRSAGVVAGVALEGHLKKLIADHKVPFRKKAMLSNLNEALKDAGVYDVLQWRRIQHLTDVRNLCGHKGEREPKNEEVEDLISETAKIVKTLF
jgi:hypothetical protein